MSTKRKLKSSDTEKPSGRVRQHRYLQPCLLMGLDLKPSYGYELIQNIQQFGFVEGQAPPGMIYRHLRQLEQDGLVVSKWVTEISGPAKRIYRLTEEGRQVLALWVERMTRQAETLQKFISLYHQKTKK
jgi:poly-beta-hydroxybutyrate-responsive repressor